MMPIFYTKKINKEGTQQFPKTWETFKIKNGEFNYKKELKKGEIAGVHNLNLEIKILQTPLCLN